MVRFIRKGYLKLKCKECHKSHSFEGRDLVFDPYGKTEKENGIERKYLCTNDFFCSCDTKIKSGILITEYPEGKIADISYETKNAEVIEKCSISILSL
jgi:hypothetical protein